ncbi:hypothetical protein bthur0013_28620 [Bacillus thuringiensis IBL 200]|nr:hypothetical protein bthur0013_28620 [Bacillus thuringiensis IBL 200]
MKNLYQRFLEYIDLPTKTDNTREGCPQILFWAALFPI